MAEAFKCKKREYLDIILDGQKKSCGYIDWERHCYISRKEEEHIFRKFSGWGASICILNYLRSKNIEIIIVVFKGNFMKSTVQEFYDNGIVYKNGKDNQLILPLKFFKISGKVEEKQVELN